MKQIYSPCHVVTYTYIKIPSTFFQIRPMNSLEWKVTRLLSDHHEKWWFLILMNFSYLGLLLFLIFVIFISKMFKFITIVAHHLDLSWGFSSSSSTLSLFLFPLPFACPFCMATTFSTATFIILSLEFSYYLGQNDLLLPYCLFNCHCVHVLKLLNRWSNRIKFGN